MKTLKSRVFTKSIVAVAAMAVLAAGAASAAPPANLGEFNFSATQ